MALYIGSILFKSPFVCSNISELYRLYVTQFKQLFHRESGSTIPMITLVTELIHVFAPRSELTNFQMILFFVFNFIALFIKFCLKVRILFKVILRYLKFRLIFISFLSKTTLTLLVAYNNEDYNMRN